MAGLPGFYRHSLALLTDLYQLTMAYGYWRLGRADEQAVDAPLAHKTRRLPSSSSDLSSSCELGAVRSRL